MQSLPSVPTLLHAQEHLALRAGQANCGLIGHRRKQFFVAAQTAQLQYDNHASYQLTSWLKKKKTHLSDFQKKEQHVNLQHSTLENIREVTKEHSTNISHTQPLPALQETTFLGPKRQKTVKASGDAAGRFAQHIVHTTTRQRETNKLLQAAQTGVETLQSLLQQPDSDRVMRNPQLFHRKTHVLSRGKRKNKLSTSHRACQQLHSTANHSSAGQAAVLNTKILGSAAGNSKGTGRTHRH